MAYCFHTYYIKQENVKNGKTGQKRCRSRFLTGNFYILYDMKETMRSETANSVFTKDSSGLDNGYLGMEWKYNVPWGPDYIVGLIREPEGKELEILMAGMIMTRALE